MDVLFLDANVLFSAAYRPDARVRQLWELGDVELITSAYAIEEARRNLPLLGPEMERTLDDLKHLLGAIRGVPSPAGRRIPALPGQVTLPEKDRPILLAALAAGASHLLTGDKRHFGALFGAEIEGLGILTPGAYLRSR